LGIGERKYVLVIAWKGSDLRREGNGSTPV